MSIPQMYIYQSFSDWITVTNSIGTEVGDLALFSGQNIGQSDIVHSLNNLDVLKYNKAGGAISGLVTIGQTLDVTGATTLTGLLTANGNITLGTNVITLNSSNGNGVFAGTLTVAGVTSLGITAISSALTVNGAATFNANITLSGNVTPGIEYFAITNGTTNKFVVDSATGNTSILGTLGIAGATTISSTLALQSDFSINTNKFIVQGASGNTIIAGTLGVTGVTTLSNSLISTLGTVTANAPVLSATQTWNNAGATFNGLLVNITNTASSANSLLLAFQQGGFTTFGVTTGGTINQQTTSSNLARTVISNLTESRTIREYQDLNDGLSSGTQGLDVNSVSEWSNTFNARWDAPTLSYIKDRATNSIGTDHAYMSRLTEDFKQQWLFSDGTTAGSTISWLKKVEFDVTSDTYKFMNVTSSTIVTPSSVATGTVSISNALVMGQVSYFNIAQIILTTVAQTVLYSLPISTYRSAIFEIQAVDVTGGKYHRTNLTVIHNGVTTVAVEYGAIIIGSACASYTTRINGANIEILATPSSTNSTTFKTHLRSMGA